MADLAYATCTGVSFVRRATYTLNHGITPGCVRIEANPQPGQAPRGPLTVEFWHGANFIRLRDCRLINTRIQAVAGQGYVWLLTIQDRRWRWKYPKIDGQYNHLLEDGRVWDDYKKKPTELATLCFQAMGEGRFDVSDLPDLNFPFVDWNRAKAAEELARLCDLGGCRVILQADDSVAIRKVGIGQPLPTNIPYMEDTDTVDPVVAPDKLILSCGPTVRELRCQIEPVGLDTDGIVRPVDDLSYAPAEGWVNQTPGIIQSVGDPLSFPSGARQRAMKSLYYWYRITTKDPDGGPLRLPGYDKNIEDINQLLPLLNRGPTPFGLDYDGYHRSYGPPMVFGYYAAGQFTYFANTTPSTSRREAPDDSAYQGDFQVDVERGLVIFDRPMFIQTDDDDYSGSKVIDFAELCLIIACTVREQTTFSLDRFDVEKDLGLPKMGTEPLYVVHDEIYKEIYYTDRTTVPPVSRDNEAQVKQEANYYLDNLAREYYVRDQRTITYAGIYPISPDGAICEVTWSVGGRGITTACFNNEKNNAIPDFYSRRAAERTRDQQTRLQGPTQRREAFTAVFPGMR